MSFPSLITPSNLHAIMGQCLILDCRHQIMDEAWGARVYADSHIEGAHFMDMENDLSGKKTGKNGRHPLPIAEDFIHKLHRLGLSLDQTVVVYDDSNGMMASRAWWMLKYWLGHSNVAVLDGGFQAWVGAGYATTKGIPSAHPTVHPAPLSPQHHRIIHVGDIEQGIKENGSWVLIDARSPERFLGKPDSIDPVKGHIPGAINHFFGTNILPSGVFKSPEALRVAWQTTVSKVGNKSVVLSCGSGVTACHNALAMEVAGINTSNLKLFVGSWSEWIADPRRPVAVGL